LGGVYVAVKGSPGGGATIAGAGAFSLVAAFIGGRHYLMRAREQDIEKELEKQKNVLTSKSQG
jgi:hypothetical protein